MFLQLRDTYIEKIGKGYLVKGILVFDMNVFFYFLLRIKCRKHTLTYHQIQYPQQKIKTGQAIVKITLL